MTTIVNAGTKDYNLVHFEWFLVDWCNYKCSYCNAAEMMVEQFSKSTSPSKYKLVLERLKKLDFDFEMDIFGGEPTLHPEINYILDQLAAMDNCKLIEIKTNLSRSLNFLQDICQHNKVKLSASYHAEYYNQTFLDKCIALKDNNFYCHINLSDNPNDWPQILNMIDQFDLHGVRYDLNLLMDTPGKSIQYSKEFFITFDSRLKSVADNVTYRFQYEDGTEEMLPAYTVFKNHMSSFTGWTCKALLYEIGNDGDIVNSCTRKPLPIFIKQEHVSACVTCPTQACHADMMLHFYKEKPSV